jgi:hypothetical protein
MGRKTKIFSRFALVALCAGLLIAVLIGASAAPAAPPPPPPGGCIPNSDTGISCPTAPTPPPPGGTTPTTTTTTTTSTGTTTTTTSTTPGTPVTTPVTGTVQGTTPGTGPGTNGHGATTPVNVIAPTATTPTPTPAPITPAVITPPVTTPPVVTASVVGVAGTAHHARIRHIRHRHRTRHVKHHKAVVPPPPPTPKAARPHPQVHLPAAVQVTSSVPTPGQVRFKATSALLAAALAGFLVLLLAFPAEVFNKTYDENEEEIHLVFTRMGLRRHHLSRFWGYLVYVLVGVGLTVWLALGEESDGNPVAVAIGLLVALPVVTFAFEFSAELYLRTRSRIPGSLHVLPTALFVAALCAVISRLIHLEPAYLYGVFAGYTAMRAGSLAEEEEGKSVLVGVAVLAVIAGISWFAWGALDGQAHGDHRDWFVILVSTAFFWIFVLAAESLVFGLIPLKYLDGSLVRRWRTSAWLIPQLLAAAFFVYVMMLHGTTKKVTTLSELVRPFAFFAGVGLLSFAFWGYFQWNGRPSAEHGEGGEGGEDEKTPAPAPTPAAAPVVAQPALLTAADILPRSALPSSSTLPSTSTLPPPGADAPPPA